MGKEPLPLQSRQGPFIIIFFKYSHVSQHSRTHLGKWIANVSQQLLSVVELYFVGNIGFLLKFITRSYHHPRSPSDRFLQVRPVAFIFK